MARFIGIYKAFSTSTVCRKERKSNKSSDDDYEEKQQSKAEGCSESSVSNVYQYKTSNTSSACQLVCLYTPISTKFNIRTPNFKTFPGRACPMIPLALAL